MPLRYRIYGKLMVRPAGIGHNRFATAKRSRPRLTLLLQRSGFRSQRDQHWWFL